MDEMRQLVRIMVKFLPQSLSFLSTSDEPGGGNRVTEPQIKQYLKATLGDEAPQPTWGMPNGWGAYLSGGHRTPEGGPCLHGTCCACCLSHSLPASAVSSSAICMHGLLHAYLGHQISSSSLAECTMCADLFTWALGRLVTDDEARSCACRQQGRSWQVKETRLAELGAQQQTWPDVA